MSAGKPLKNHDLVPPPGKVPGRGRAGGPCSDDDDVGVHTQSLGRGSRRDGCMSSHGVAHDLPEVLGVPLDGPAGQPA